MNPQKGTTIEPLGSSWCGFGSAGHPKSRLCTRFEAFGFLVVRVAEPSNRKDRRASNGP